MFGSSTVSLIVGQISSSATGAFMEYKEVFLLIAGVVLAIGVMEWLSTVLFTRRESIMDLNREERD